MAESVYVLCAAMSVLCAVLLYTGWIASHARLLLWSSLCFAGLALNNVMLLVDLVVVPGIDLFYPRTIPALAGLGLLLYGLIWDLR